MIPKTVKAKKTKAKAKTASQKITQLPRVEKLRLLKEVKDLLKKLGKNSHEISANLKSLKVKGEQKSARTCPISEYLRKNGVKGLIIVAIERISLDFGDVSIPFVVREFIKEFDRSYFPKLIKK